MKYLKAVFALVLIAGVVSVVEAQQAFTNDKIEYILELPSDQWRWSNDDHNEHKHVEFIYRDRLEGFLVIRKESVDAGTTVSDLARRDLGTSRFLPGFVEGGEENFKGRLNGVTVTYEFIRTGKPMMGRIYYLQADNRTIYALRFTGLKDRLPLIRNQTDSIARSFRIK